MDADPALLTIAQARRALDAGDLSAVELTEAVLSRIERLDPRLGAYLHVDPESAREQAQQADRLSGALALKGIPICVKDMIDVAGVATTAGSANWRRIPDADAVAVSRLRKAGAVVVGKGHTNEFAFGIDGKNPFFGDCRNPYAPDRITGGSSSGPAAATAAGLALAGVGTDTSGSIRVPASFCGLVGVRPTVGLVPTMGVVPLAWSYDTVGPLARTVADAALVLDVLTAAERTTLDDEVGGLRIGVLEQLTESAQPYVESATWKIARELEDGGAEVRAVRLDMLPYVDALHQLIQHPEAAQVHASWFEQQYRHYSDPVRVRLAAARQVPAAAYLNAQRARRKLIDEVASRMKELDALLAPSTASVAPPIDSERVTIRGRDAPLRAALLSCVLVTTQLAGPVVAVPIGSHQGLPFGMQIIGRPFAERLLLSIAAAVERRWRWSAPLAVG